MRRLIAIFVVVFGGFMFLRFLRSRYSFCGKVALVTGGSRGLGLVLARQICDEGGKVVLLARDPAELDRARVDLESQRARVELGNKSPHSKTEVLTIECDLLDRAQIEPAVEQTLRRFGRIDIVINNAGIMEAGPLDHMKGEDFEKNLALHFWAPFELVRLIVPQMRRQGGGRIVNISSIGGKIAVPHMASYTVSKFALTGFSDAIRAELAPDNIYVTTVVPGLMRTGSHVNAKFKGQRAAEFAWFSALAGMPLISMNAERAARKILAACRRGQASLTLTLAARAAIAGNTIFPNLTGHVMKVGTRFLPGSTTPEADEAQPGAELPRLIPRWFTQLADGATEKNNESGIKANRERD
jgi:NAD(P)-dependent dehydrogenase (short-subunit alcohol dehydrogenase family)